MFKRSHIIKKKSGILSFLLVLVAAFLLAGCGSNTGVGGASPDEQAIHTQVAGTLQAEATQAAGATAVAQLTQMAQSQPTATLESSPTATLPPTATPTTAPPTQTSAPPTPTKPPVPCDWAQFVSDVTVKDGTSFRPDEKFTKTWRLKNIGTCTWTTDYSLAYSSGTTMDGPERVRLSRKVAPGETIDISVDLIAPSGDGTYTGKWMLRNANGDWFGLGARANQEFWVKVIVDKPTQVYYDFSRDYCAAVWRSGSIGQMACPSLPGFDANPPGGALTHDDAPRLESGGTDDERALITIPNDGQNGYIQANYPAIRINSGDRFRAVVGCMYDRWSCSVTFNLSYRVGTEGVRDLGSWSQTYDGEIARIDIDLSSLAGRDVEFFLTVYSNGSNVDDWAFWLMPRILR
jgi:predicted small secreted protein